MTGSFVVSPCFEQAQLWGRTEINESGDLEEEFDRLLPGRRRRGSGVLTGSRTHRKPTGLDHRAWSSPLA